MKAMILAAGRGERMRPLTDTCPKPLLSVGGKPLIVWQIERLFSAGIRDIVINHAHLGVQIENALGDGSQYGVRITYSAEENALETAGGIVKALPLLGDSPFFVVSADIYCECDYRRLLGGLSWDDQTQAFLWMTSNRSWHSSGDFSMHDGRLYLNGHSRLTYANFGVFHPVFFSSVVPGTRIPLRPLLDMAISAGHVRATKLDDVIWENLGTPEQLMALDIKLCSRVPP